jgi:hypothetical protein
MKTSRLIRALALFAAVALGSGTHAFAANQETGRIQGSFTCNAQPLVSVFSIPGPNGTLIWLPKTLDVVVAGAGSVSHMEGPVVCYSDDEHVDMFNPSDGAYIGVGGLTSIMRDRNNNTITMKLDMYVDLASTSKDHPITFHGKYTITGGTGRFAGAQGAGEWSGWADNNDNPPADPTFNPSALGHWEFSGTLVLPKHP